MAINLSSEDRTRLLLVEDKAELSPHGHLGLWVKEKSDVSQTCSRTV
jgi:hypothetical protein